MTENEAKKIATFIAALRKSANDAEASKVPFLFRVLKGDGSLVKVNSRIYHNGTLKRATVDLWDTNENSPENAPTLWEDVTYKDGYRVIPEAIPSTDSFSKGDCGWWKEVLYKSIFDGANVWTPEQLASAWEVVENA